MGGWGERERVAGQETSSADEVIGLKIKRWRHLKPIPVNELSGAPGKGGDRRGQGGGRRAGPRARPPIPRPPGSAARLGALASAARGGVGSRSVPEFGDSQAGSAGAAGRSRGCPRRPPRGFLLPRPRARQPRPRARVCVPTGISGCAPPPPRTETRSLFPLAALFPAASPA